MITNKQTKPPIYKREVPNSIEICENLVSQNTALPNTRNWQHCRRISCTKQVSLYWRTFDIRITLVWHWNDIGLAFVSLSSCRLPRLWQHIWRSIPWCFSFSRDKRKSLCVCVFFSAKGRLSNLFGAKSFQADNGEIQVLTWFYTNHLSEPNNNLSFLIQLRAVFNWVSWNQVK